MTSIGTEQVLHGLEIVDFNHAMYKKNLLYNICLVNDLINKHVNCVVLLDRIRPLHV